MNLVGHVAVALAPERADPSADFLVGCMLPDLAAIARVRLTRPDGDLGRGVAFHHACDAVFHESEWFRSANRTLRDTLVDAGVESGPARACSHAGVEMLLDSTLIDDPQVFDAARSTLEAVSRDARVLSGYAPAEVQAVAASRFRRIGSSLDPARYRDPQFVAERLHAMTSGRRRIELPAAHVDIVAAALHDATPGVQATANAVAHHVRTQASRYHQPSSPSATSLRRKA